MVEAIPLVVHATHEAGIKLGGIGPYWTDCLVPKSTSKTCVAQFWSARCPPAIQPTWNASWTRATASASVTAACTASSTACQCQRASRSSLSNGPSQSVCCMACAGSAPTSTKSSSSMSQTRTGMKRTCSSITSGNTSALTRPNTAGILSSICTSSSPNPSLLRSRRSAWMRGWPRPEVHHRP